MSNQPKETTMTKSKSQTFRTLEIANQYGASICTARRLTATEGRQYQAWFRKIGMVSVDDAVDVNERIARKMVDGRKSDGQFMGCDNLAWTITEDEYNQLSQSVAQPRNNAPLTIEETAQSEHNSETLALQEQDKRNRGHNGYCPKCHTYCYGDCESN
jgi:hypothetical protein